MICIVEGIAGTWHYHLAPNNDQAHALCGKLTMPTSLMLDAWGQACRNDKIQYHWCEACRLAAWRA